MQRCKLLTMQHRGILRSWVWEHFTLNESKDKTICKVCPVGTTSLIHKGTTSNLINHLKGKPQMTSWFVNLS